MGDERDEPPTTKAGAAAVRAAVRPVGDAAVESDRTPVPTIADARGAPAPRRARTTQQSALAMTECAACHVATPVARFCTECGATLVQRNFCSGCGNHLQALAKFCDGCGLKVPV